MPHKACSKLWPEISLPHTKPVQSYMVGRTEEAIFQVLFKAIARDIFAPQSLFKATVGGTEEAIFQVL